MLMLEASNDERYCWGAPVSSVTLVQLLSPDRRTKLQLFVSLLWQYYSQLSCKWGAADWGKQNGKRYGEIRIQRRGEPAQEIWPLSLEIIRNENVFQSGICHRLVLQEFESVFTAIPKISLTSAQILFVLQRRFRLSRCEIVRRRF